MAQQDKFLKLMPDSFDAQFDEENQTEAQLRIELAAAYRLTHMFNMDFLIFNHITVRVPGPEKHFLINPYGLSYDEITASRLLKIDLKGNLISGPSGSSVNSAGFVIHGAIHEAREDLHCVMHTHTVAGVAISACESGLMVFSQDTMMFNDRIGYHDYEGFVCDVEERKRLLDDMGQLPVLILRNHGLLTAAPTIAGAFTMMWILEHCCRSQVAVLSMGQGVKSPPKSISRQTAHHFWDGNVPPRHFGRGPFAALMRRLDRTDPSYRE
jgi:ribulose-5-phosphate 4-epimerase/fuculose-1-phosphate aldolase